ncbi:(2Fe-2S)-binding protein [Pseudoclavibacter sp. RFBA6]|uniref:(2Fe-2S)-binding protein n=1 Tax=Pseudoclavibacter sp. RFBA6 TaxID=2080573 RepID=UPI000CE8088C|nr:(2Fe-2S)-binding protein [Pseudoclavibacter sp. RFBA6]PPG38881.1 proline dehydrogenase [Pseudoclavibacter sp. RFBA6]
MSERAVRGDGVEKPVRITVDGEPVEGVEGQSIAGVLLGSGRVAWRETAVAGKPRGLFCGIGVCFDCLVTVDGVPDVRACQRRACDGDEVSSQ